MRTVQHSIELPVPADTAWQIVGDLREDPRWRNVDDIDVHETGTQRGDRVTERLSLATQDFEVELSVSEVGPGRRLVLAGGGESTLVFAWREVSEAGPDRCRVDLILEVEFRGLKRFFARFLMSAWESKIESELSALASHVTQVSRQQPGGEAPEPRADRSQATAS